MQEYVHSCIKCQTQYKDTDPDPYYCPPCNEKRKEIAKEVDKKIFSRPRKQVKSDFQKYDEECRLRGTAFIPYKSL